MEIKFLKEISESIFLNSNFKYHYIVLYLKFLCPNKIVLKIIKKDKVFFKVKIHVLHENGEFSFKKIQNLKSL